ncbi:MAG: diguanylate cyclase [Butyrivibrio sp.]|nr:diguanylate cyclase [Butyrivibrio sp.]
MQPINTEGKIGYSSSADFGPNDILYMLKDLPDACCVFKVLTDPFGTVKDMLFLFANEKYARLVGIPTAELIGSTYYSVVKNQDEDWIKFSYQAAILRQSSINRTYNSQFDKWFEFWAVPVYQKGFCAFIIHDVTADKHNEDYHRYQSNTSNVLIECAKAMSTSDFSKGIRRCLRRIGQNIDADRVYVIRHKDSRIEQMYEWISPNTADLPSKKIFEEYDLLEIFTRQLAGKNVFYLNDTAAIAEKNPELYGKFLAGKCARYMVAALKDKNENIGFLVADNYSLETQMNVEEVMETVAIFIAALIKNQELTNELMYLGGHDALTGLGNRYALNQMLLVISETTDSVGVCYTDINGLKAINDEMGHEEGDKLIVSMSNLFAGIFKRKNCFRVGGDEFVAVVPGISEEAFIKLVEKLRDKSKKITMAIGYSWAHSCCDVRKLIRNADEAMYNDKAQYYGDHERRQSGQ